MFSSKKTFTVNFNFSRAAEPVLQAPPAQAAPPRHVQSPAERKKDIVAQAMQEQKIFEENIPKAEPLVKQEPGVVSGGGDAANSAAEKTGTDSKATVVTATKTAANNSPTQRKPYQRTNQFNRQQIMPRLQVGGAVVLIVKWLKLIRLNRFGLVVRRVPIATGC